MKKSILIGSIIVITILILMSFTSTINAQSIDRNQLVKKFTDFLKTGEWFPGCILLLLLFLFYFIFWTIGSTILKILDRLFVN